MAIFGVVAGFSYYVLTVRNAGIARKTQVVMSMSLNMLGAESNRMNIELLGMEWEDFDDFRRKYDSTVDPEGFSRRWQVWLAYESAGFMLHLGLVDVETVYSMMGGFSIIQFWEKFKPVILEQRRLYSEPYWFRWMEYLADETVKYRAGEGLPELTLRDVYTTAV